MNTYVMLTRIDPEERKSIGDYEALARDVLQQVRRHCPQVRWIGNYAVLGPYDYLDIFEAPDELSATKVALIVRSAGHGITETWPAVSWDQFRELCTELNRQGLATARR